MLKSIPKISLFIFLVYFNTANTQEYFINIEAGYSEYDSPTYNNGNAYSFSLTKKMTLYGEYLKFSTGIGFSHFQVLLKDVTILPVSYGDPVKIYNNDIVNNFSYIEIPIFLEIPYNFTNNWGVLFSIGYSIDFSLEIESKIHKKELQYEGFHFLSDIDYDFSESDEETNSDFQIIPIFQYGIGIRFSNFILGVTHKTILPYKRIDQLSDYSQKTFIYSIYLKYGF